MLPRRLPLAVPEVRGLKPADHADAGERAERVQCAGVALTEDDDDEVAAAVRAQAAGIFTVMDRCIWRDRAQMGR